MFYPHLIENILFVIKKKTYDISIQHLEKVWNKINKVQSNWIEQSGRIKRKNSELIVIVFCLMNLGWWDNQNDNTPAVSLYRIWSTHHIRSMYTMQWTPANYMFVLGTFGGGEMLDKTIFPWNNKKK